MDKSELHVLKCGMCSISIDPTTYFDKKYKWSSKNDRNETSIELCIECNYFLVNGIWKSGSIYPMYDEICFACERPSFEKYVENGEKTNEQELIYQRNKAIEGYTIATNNFKKALIRLKEYELIIQKQQLKLEQVSKSEDVTNLNTQKCK